MSEHRYTRDEIVPLLRAVIRLRKIAKVASDERHADMIANPDTTRLAVARLDATDDAIRYADEVMEGFRAE